MEYFSLAFALLVGISPNGSCFIGWKIKVILLAGHPIRWGAEKGCHVVLVL